jgi:hypothetical protein
MEPSGLHTIRILDRSGDTPLTYDPADRAAVDEIERRFARLMERNFVAFDVSTHPGRIITQFDPAVSEIIVSPRFAGG